MPLELYHPSKYSVRLSDGRVECTLCPRRCRLREGQRGLCFVRLAHKGAVHLTTYGRSSGFCIDPIEKKPLNHFLPGTPVLSFGTAGCNLTCRFCQNWHISKAKQWDQLGDDQASPERIAYAAKALKCRSVAFTYNDPVIFLEYAVDTAKACHRQNIRTVAVTAGYIEKEARQEFFAHMDAANIDLKGFSQRFYKKLCSADLEPVLDTLRYVYHETDTWLEITTLLIPGWNDSPEEVEALSRWVLRELGPDVPLHFSAFHPDYKLTDVPPTPKATLQQARYIAMDVGLYYVYTGNVHDEEGGSTYCSYCGQKLIGRNWYQLSTWNLTAEGKCSRCGKACAGVFEASPGDWGRKRLPVRLSDFQ